MKLQMCNKPGGASQIFRAGQANSYCTLEHGHPGPCVFVPQCPTCGHTISTTPPPNITVAPSVSTTLPKAS